MGIIIAVVIFILVIYLSGSPERQARKSGKKGENRVSMILKRLGYHVLDNQIFIVEGRTVQIDHIAVSRYGMLVLETKNHHGIIHGDAYQKEWIQESRGERYPFFNPVWQNYGHFRAVKALTGLPDEKILPVVVFAGNPWLDIRTSDMPVMTAETLPFLLSQLKEPIFSEEEVEYYTEMLTQLNCRSRKTEAQHVKSIKQMLKAA